MQLVRSSRKLIRLLFLSSNLWKHIQSFDLQERYRNTEGFALHLRMLAALAFIPPKQLSEHSKNWSMQLEFLGEADQFIDYFEDTYIGRFRRNAPRRQPMFPIELWNMNMFHRTQDELPRTNNNVDVWHRRFQSNVSAPHHNMEILGILKKEQCLARVEALQALRGHQPPAQRRTIKYQFRFRNTSRMFYIIGSQVQ